MSDDTHYKECPDCRKRNGLAAPKCICGYKWADLKQHCGSDIDRRFCHYVSSGRQCPLPGSVSYDIGPGVSMWCSGHLDCRSGPDAERVYEDAVANYEQIMAARKESVLDRQIRLPKEPSENAPLAKGETHISEKLPEFEDRKF